MQPANRPSSKTRGRAWGVVTKISLLVRLEQQVKVSPTFDDSQRHRARKTNWERIETVKMLQSKGLVAVSSLL